MITEATLPRAFIIGPDSTTVIGTSTSRSIQADQDAQVVTTIPRRCGPDGTPITWRDIASQIHAISGADKGIRDRFYEAAHEKRTKTRCA